MKVTPNQIKYILDLPTKKEANKMIATVLYPNDYAQAKLQAELNPNLICDAILFEVVKNIPIVSTIVDIKENCLSRQAFRIWMLRDYPMGKMILKSPPKTIRLPVGLRELLSDRQLSYISNFWNSRYGDFMYDENDKFQFNP